MELSLFEIAPSDSDPSISDLIVSVSRVTRARGGELLESQETRAGHLFLIVEGTEAAEAVRAEIASYAGASGPHPVRLVGAEETDVKSSGPGASYLVEWDLPEGLDMDSYLARKRAASVRYAEVPEVRFLRTYVREDLAKCLCLYDGPGEGAVRDARKAVDAPVSRFHELAGANRGIDENAAAEENGSAGEDELGSISRRGGGG